MRSIPHTHAAEGIPSLWQKASRAALPLPDFSTTLPHTCIQPHASALFQNVTHPHTWQYTSSQPGTLCATAGATTPPRKASYAAEKPARSCPEASRASAWALVGRAGGGACCADAEAVRALPAPPAVPPPLLPPPPQSAPPPSSSPLASPPMASPRQLPMRGLSATVVPPVAIDAAAAGHMPATVVPPVAIDAAAAGHMPTSTSCVRSSGRPSGSPSAARSSSPRRYASRRYTPSASAASAANAGDAATAAAAAGGPPAARERARAASRAARALATCGSMMASSCKKIG
eukprot:365635-Chlamydomonas_euryale.AAC.4